jgi:uroporphyrinogen-III synthase
MRLLVTRPEPEAERTAAKLRARGHVAVVVPLLRIEPVEHVPIDGGPFAALLATSANAAAIAGHARFAELRAVPVLAVNDLAALVAARCKPRGSLLYVAGADRSGDLDGVLSGRGFAVKTAVVYRAVASGALPAALAGMRYDGVLHFSRRTSEAYVDAARAGRLPGDALTAPVHFCMSAQVAEPLIEAGAGGARVAAEPTEAALLALIPEV